MEQQNYKADFNNNVRYLPAIIPNTDILFEQLQKQVLWKQIPWKNGTFLPRLCCHSVEQFAVGDMLKTWLEDFFFCTMNVKCTVTNIFGNKYRNGQDYLPDHRDQYNYDGKQLHVVSLSFGATRLFRFSNNGVLQPKYYLHDGDIILFSPTQNKNTKHGIPKQPQITEPRINLTCFCTFELGDPYVAPVDQNNIPQFNGVLQEPVVYDIPENVSNFDQVIRDILANNPNITHEELEAIMFGE